MPKAPYQHLYIYEVDGDARQAAAHGAGPGFLGLWLEGSSSFLFYEHPADGQVEGLLAAHEGLRLLDRHYLTYEQWQGGMTLESLELPRLLVAPAWEEPPALAPGQKLLLLDPGLVFGNGLHPTTRHSLEFLCHLAAQGPLGPALDLGCGTGILGLAAALLGADPVWAVDLNPLCVSTTRRNADRNQLETQVFEGQAGDFLERPARLVLCNLHWEVQKDLWTDGEKLKGKQHLILSGITRSQAGPLQDMLDKLGYELKGKKESQSTWFTLWLSWRGQARRNQAAAASPPAAPPPQKT